MNMVCVALSLTPLDGYGMPRDSGGGACKQQNVGRGDLTTVVVHFQDTLLAHGAVVRARWLWFPAWARVRGVSAWDK